MSTKVNVDILSKLVIVLLIYSVLTVIAAGIVFVTPEPNYAALQKENVTEEDLVEYIRPLIPTLPVYLILYILVYSTIFVVGLLLENLSREEKLSGFNRCGKYLSWYGILSLGASVLYYVGIYLLFNRNFDLAFMLLNSNRILIFITIIPYIIAIYNLYKGWSGLEKWFWLDQARLARYLTIILIVLPIFFIFLPVYLESVLSLIEGVIYLWFSYTFNEFSNRLASLGSK
ncbi:MAG: hypothetical protein ACP6IP_06230 [Candidatus Njordarchaeia archaeon]